MCSDRPDGTIEEKLQRLAANPPTLEGAKALLEDSGRYENVEIVPGPEDEGASKTE